MLFSEKNLNPREYNPLALAYIGDTVFDLYIRTRILEKGNRRVTDMHKSAVGYVKASSQAKIVHIIGDMLTEEETGILKWGRNAKVNTHPSGASIGEYHLATGFETLLGFLYLDGKDERLCEILDAAYANFNKE
ncbi:MAG: Mini-ribonuclease 3 [Clostridia bacterium]